MIWGVRPWNAGIILSIWICPYSKGILKKFNASVPFIPFRDLTPLLPETGVESAFLLGPNRLVDVVACGLDRLKGAPALGPAVDASCAAAGSAHAVPSSPPPRSPAGGG